MTTPQQTVRVLTLNVASPSVARAEAQLAWLADRDDDVVVLTEISTGQGSELLASALYQSGWDISAERLERGQRGVLVGSRVRLDRTVQRIKTSVLSHRLVAVALPDGPEILGVYVPSRNETDDSIRRKRDFLAALDYVVAVRDPRRPAVLLGDFNIVEPGHHPRHGVFEDWEYGFYNRLVDSGWADAYRLRHPDGRDHSWVGPHDDGYRYDHTLVTTQMVEQVADCKYLHETRALGLSDHSAMLLVLGGVSVERLKVAATLSIGPASLF